MRSDLSKHYCCVQKGMENHIRVIWAHKLFFSLLVSEGVIIDSRTDPRSRISLPRLIIIFVINQGQQ
jgi:hypothetical protein